MGIYRYILSVMVLLSHSERMLMLNGKYINQGKIAVISFLLMTGYTNCFSLKRLDRGYSDYLIKRVLRIWPMYAVTTLLIYLIVGLFDFPYETIAEVTLRGIIADVLLLPRSVLNEVLISNAIPAAWTVGLQMVYYFISPLLYKLTKEQETSTSAVVIFLFIYGTSFATFALSMLNVVSPGYSYSVFWGMLWVFMAGSCLTEAPSKGMLSIVSVSWGVCAALTILYFINPEEYLFSNIESAHRFCDRFAVDSNTKKGEEIYARQLAWDVKLWCLPMPLWCQVHHASFGRREWIFESSGHRHFYGSCAASTLGG